MNLPTLNCKKPLAFDARKTTTEHRVLKYPADTREHVRPTVIHTDPLTAVNFFPSVKSPKITQRVADWNFQNKSLIVLGQRGRPVASVA